ncbi:YciI family protein [Micromonospora sp. URMC 103]|uniref:YciI family protein n=1 Tax=Micromonospora sp. URMC 103 TaxID=3423406 RepID=UPI003F1BAAEB
MKYMLQVIGFTDAEFAEGEGPAAEEFVAWLQALTGAGALAGAGYLDDYKLATSVQVNGAGEQLITNGPFPESREYLGGWAIVDVPDLDAALAWAARCPGAKYGRVEVRPVLG